jgi:hypothetical protein
MNLAFRYNIMEQFIPIMSDQSQILISVLRSKFANEQEEEDKDVTPAITNAILDIIYGMRSDPCICN